MYDTILNLLISMLFTVTPPCASEDANNCHWDASVQGNGTGNSFVVIDDRVVAWRDGTYPKRAMLMDGKGGTFATSASFYGNPGHDDIDPASVGFFDTL